VDGVRGSSRANVIGGSNLQDLLAEQRSYFALHKVVRIAQYALKSDLVLVLHSHVEEVVQRKNAHPIFARLKKRIHQ
jgi:hypothetical protein